MRRFYVADPALAKASMGRGCFHPRNPNEPVEERESSVQLQWGRDVSIPEIAMPLFYSVFNDLRACSRAPLHLKHISPPPTTPHAATSCRPAPLHPREPPPLNPPRPAARTRLPRRKHRVFRNLPLQNTRQQPRLDFQQPPVAHAVFEQGVRHQRIHPQLIRPEECLSPARRSEERRVGKEC